MTTLDDATRRATAGVTRKRCADCKKFAKLVPGETKCAPCMGMLPLDLTSVKRGGR